MKAIVEYSEEEYVEMRAKSARLREAIKDYSRDSLLQVTKRYGYSMYTFRGTYSELLVEALGRHPDSDEIIMLVDGGFSHFGAHCGINTSLHTFSGRVNTD